MANDLRVGKHCMIGGFPCKIRELNRAAPGKHGHAKLRTAGNGIFDDKKRETIYAAQNVVQVPVIQKLQEVRCVTRRDGFDLESNEHYRLPSLLSFPEDELIQHLPDEGTHVMLSVVACCGHYKIMEVHATTDAVSTGDGLVSEQSQVLSKKEARKLKKQQRKQAVATV